MKCPNCGFDNRIGAKFCSECAYKLANATADNIGLNAPPDDALSEELVELWKLYEEDQLDLALEKIANTKKNLSGTSSVYSLAALIYEKRAKQAYDSGNMDAYYEDLANAAKEYEEVVRQNPRSAADRAKLLAVRHKLSTTLDKSAGINQLKIIALLKRVPLPIWAAAAVFVMVIAGSLIARGISGKQNRAQGPVTPAQVNVQAPYRTQPSPYQNPYQMPPVPSQQQRSAGGVYTFPPAGGNQSNQRQQTPDERRNYAERQQPYDAGSERTLAPVEPMQLPSTVRVIPNDDYANRTNAGQTPSAQIQVTPGAGGQGSSEMSVQIQQGRPEEPADDADTWLARAIELEKQGHDSYARAAAERAQRLYLRDLADGKNSENSANGIELTKGVLKKLDNKKQ